MCFVWLVFVVRVFLFVYLFWFVWFFLDLFLCSCQVNLFFQGFRRTVKLFSWNDGPEAAVGGGQWALGSFLLWGLRNLIMARGQGHRKSLEQEQSFMGISGAPKA